MKIKMLRCIILATAGLLPFLQSAGSQNASCPAGWTPYDQSCYVVIEEEQTWPVAQVVCQTLGGNLATITNSGENKAIEDLVKTAKGETEAWIGLHDMVKEGHFQWVTSNREAVYTNWFNGEPGGVSVENCVAITTRPLWKHWHDYPCWVNHTFVCELST